MSKKVKILDSNIVARSRLFKIEQIDLEFQNGEKRQYERVTGLVSSAVMILPLIDDDRVLLIREYAAGVGHYTLGFPKGACDEGESILETANRELQEEVGFAAGTLEEICFLSASPGYLKSVMHLVVAKNLQPSILPGDEPEPIEVIEWHLDNIDKLLSHPEFYEARSVAALLMLARMRDANM